MFKITIDQHYFQDNYESGEVHGSYNYETLEEYVDDKDVNEVVANALKKANEYSFINTKEKPTYDLHEDGVLSIFVPCYFLNSDSDNYFYKASEDDIKDFNDGKMDLWQMEYQIHIRKFEIIPIDVNDFDNETLELFD